MNLWRLEWLRLTRTRRLIALIGTYAFFGFVGPLTARYLSAIIDRFGGGDIQVVVPDPIPVDGIVQFTGNIYPIGLLVAVIVAAGALTPRALPEMAIFLRTRVTSAARLVIPRFTVVFAAAAAAYVIGIGIAWYETAVLLGALPAGGLLLGSLPLGGGQSGGSGRGSGAGRSARCNSDQDGAYRASRVAPGFGPPGKRLRCDHPF